MDVLSQLSTTICSCQRCPLSQGRIKAVPGEGPINAKVFFIGEAPGEENDRTGRPFVGHGGRLFDSILSKCDFRREEVFVTNAVKCRPPMNRRPLKREISVCRPFLTMQLEIIKPLLIITLGSAAFEAVMGRIIRLTAEHGEIQSYEGTPLCPTFHPNAIRYLKGGMATIVKDISACLAVNESTSSSDQQKHDGGTL